MNFPIMGIYDSIGYMIAFSKGTLWDYGIVLKLGQIHSNLYTLLFVALNCLTGLALSDNTFTEINFNFDNSRQEHMYDEVLSQMTR